MKKKLLILSACIGLILACFPFTLCAEEDPQSTYGVSAPSPVPLLDSYFYQNYDVLPYISGSGSYINTGINGGSNLRVSIRMGNMDPSATGYVFGSRVGNSSSEFSLRFTGGSNNSNRFKFYSGESNTLEMDLNPYRLYSLILDKNEAYVDGSLFYTFTDTTFNNNLPICIFGVNSNGTFQNITKYNLYEFNIYDYDANSGEGAYVRYYYPAKSKSGDVIGLYDAVSKTFFTSGNAVVFENPTDEKVLTFDIGDFITAGLGWIGDILDFAIAEPLIICFMAIGLAGAMFRWGRRLVHF